MVDDQVDTTIVRDWLDRFGEVIRDQRAHLTELDSAIGDGDHGVNMARGMTAVGEALNGLDDDATLAELSKKVGMALVSKVGGASGPLYGTFFLRFGTGTGTDDVDVLDGSGLADALQAALDGVVARGKAERQDKTMVDAIGPAVDALREAVDDDQSIAAATAAAADAADEGRDATEPLVARKGRASYLGERSAGHIDPGAASSALLFRALADATAHGS